jgi:hypothetical protein
MTDLQNRIEQLELQGNDAELLGLLSCDPQARRRSRILADNYRLQAIEVRYGAVCKGGGVRPPRSGTDEDERH